MPRILSLEMQGFKSFPNKVKLNFPNGLVVIVGPNGSGKTNIMDSICFVLGKTSKKELRAARLSHLIFNGGKSGKAAEFAKVSLNLDNSKKEFPYTGKIFQISRTVDKDGVSTFRINGNRCTLAEVRNALVGANINPDGFNIIMQGEIARFADMPAVDRRQIIEDIAGIKTYEEKKSKSLNELEKVEKKINEGEITLKEKKKYLDELSVDKLQAEKFLRKKDDLELTRGILTLKRLNNKQAEEKELSDNIEKIKKEQETLKENIKKIDDEIKVKESEIAEISKKLERGGEDERIALEKDIALLQDELNDLSVVINGHKKETERINDREKQLKKSLLDNREELEKMKSKENLLKKNIDELKSNLSGRKGMLSKLSSSDYFKLKSELVEVQREKSEKISILKDMQEKWKKRIDLEELNDTVDDLKKELANLESLQEEKAEELKEKEEKRSEVEKYLSHLKVEMGRIEERKEKRGELGAIEWVIEKDFSGVVGILSKLIETDDKLLQSVIKSKNGIVVKDRKAADKCISALNEEKAGIVRFYPLDSRTKGESSVSSKFKCSEKYRELFEAVLSDISATGETLTDGIAIIGGYGVGIEELQTKIGEIEDDIERYSYYLEDVNRKIKDLNGELSGFDKKGFGLKKDLEIANDKIKDIKTLLSKVSEDSMVNIRGDIADLEKSEKNMGLGLQKTSGVSEEEVSKIRKSIKEDEDNLTELNKELIELQTKTENIIKRDISSFESILSSLAKEKEDFSREMDESSKRVVIVGKELKKKKSMEKEFFERLKRYFNSRDKLRNALSGIENRKIRLEQKLETREKEVQDMRVKKAEVSANIEGLKERMKDFEGMEIPGTRKDERELEIEIRGLERDVASFGAVNMKALETFKEVESEYNSLNEKVEKLEEERQKILAMIDEIEGKKKSEFLRTFKDINKNLSDVFSSLNPGGSAKLVLEDEEDPFSGGIDVFARPGGKKIIPMRLLSGGEKTLVALAFVFAIQEYQPAPFYIMDEIDAALDKYNSEKLAELISKYSKRNQFIIISHNDEVISSSDYMYGVSMRDNGVSQVVSIKLPE